MLLSQKLNSSLNLRKKEELLLQQYDKGDEICGSRSEIWQIYRGVVQLSKIQQNGDEIILGWVSANGVFGNNLDSSQMYRAIALSDVYVKRYSSQDVFRQPLLAKQFLSQFSDRLIKSQKLLSIISIRRVEDRLKQLLLMLKQEIGQAKDDGVRLQVRFTHQHLAEVIHTTRVTVTRVLGDFQTQGSIYFDDARHIVIRDL